MNRLSKYVLVMSQTLITGKNPHYECPICDFSGCFLPWVHRVGTRPFARCPQCGSFERHRLQSQVIAKLLSRFGGRTNIDVLHFAPEPIISPLLRRFGGRYVTADLFRSNVDLKLDIQNLSLESNTFDLVYASHVMEHVVSDVQAAREIYRVLRPGGIAILPVPVVCHITVEYPEPNPNEHMHVRAVGRDWFDRIKAEFDGFELLTSSDVPEKYQTCVHENRAGYPNKRARHRPAMDGWRHLDYVPIYSKALYPK
jgi:predicted SAM-dependent methyltransferase